jgi:hypothetical protein
VGKRRVDLAPYLPDHAAQALILLRGPRAERSPPVARGYDPFGPADAQRRFRKADDMKELRRAD